MTLPQFLLLICAVVLAGGLTMWAATSAGVPLAAIGLSALIGAGVLSLMARVG